MSTRNIKVVVIGASGIGKNHARWFHEHGCDVSAFLGSSPQSVASTQEVLKKNFGFAGRGYHDLATMLREEKPDAVCISSPPELHYQQALTCFEYGAHVLCEKPLVGDEKLPNEKVLQQAQHLIEVANEKNLVFGTQMQYAFAVPYLRELANLKNGEPLSEWTMEMETKNIKHGRSHEKIWIDMSPHPLSVLQKMSPSACIDWDSVQCDVREQETEARFQVSFDGQSEPCNARVVVRVNPERQAPLRRFIINEKNVDFTARNNAQGKFCAYLSNGEREIELRDMVDILIGNFLDAVEGKDNLLVTGADGAQNVEWQLKILEHSQQNMAQ